MPHSESTERNRYCRGTFLTILRYDPIKRMGQSVTRDLPWSIDKLRELPPFEFENWAVIAIGGRPNKAQVGRPDIDAFEAVMMREDRTKGFFVSFDFSSDAISEIGAFFKKTGKSIVALTVKDILDEKIAYKLA
jgi:hypothetical protein